MKNSIKIALTFLAFILGFLFFPILFEWIKDGHFEVSTEKIVMAVTLGIVTPFVLMLSQKIKNSFVFVGVALVFMFAAIFIISNPLK